MIQPALISLSTIIPIPNATYPPSACSPMAPITRDGQIVEVMLCGTIFSTSP